MQILLAISFIFLCFFFLLLFNIKIKDVDAAVKKAQENVNKTLKSSSKKKKHPIANFAKNIQDMLTAMEQKGKFYVILGFSVLMAIVGISVGLTVGNYFLIPVCAAGFAAILFLYLRFLFVKYNKMVMKEMEIALSTISLSYERSENILQSYCE